VATIAAINVDWPPPQQKDPSTAVNELVNETSQLGILIDFEL